MVTTTSVDVEMNVHGPQFSPQTFFVLKNDEPFTCVVGYDSFMYHKCM
jgi:hypothetical protein